MGSLSLFHWLLVLLIVVLIFGTKKLPHIGKDIGHAIRSFKDGLKSDSGEPPSENPAPEHSKQKTETK